MLPCSEASDNDIHALHSVQHVPSHRRELFFHGHNPHGHYPHGHHPHHPHTPHSHFPPPPSPPRLPPPPSPPPYPPRLPPPPSPPPQACTETCSYASDGDCDDGGPGAEYSDCSLGIDCRDCGPRPLQPPPPPYLPGTMVVSNTVNLNSALANPAVGRIVLAPGTYILSAELSVTRSVVIEAAVRGSARLDAQAGSSSPRRVMYINLGQSGVVQIIGLVISRGFIRNVCAQVRKVAPMGDLLTRLL
jgi:hypothetical protein